MTALSELKVVGRIQRLNYVHINILELMAVKIGVMALCKNMNDIHVRFMVDNQTAVTYLNNMAKDIWQYADARNVWVTSAHIPSSDNPTADTNSGKFNGDTE